MKKSILRNSIALAVAGVFGATVAVTAADVTPVPVTQQQEETTSVAPMDPTPVPTATKGTVAAASAATPTAPVPAIDTATAAKAPGQTKVVRASNRTVDAVDADTTGLKAEKVTKTDKADKAMKADKGDKAIKGDKGDKAIKPIDAKKSVKSEKADPIKGEKNVAKKDGKQGTTKNVKSPAQPSGVVDENSVFVVGANQLLDQFETKYGNSKITNVSFKAENKTAVYEVEGFNTSGAHSMKLDVATGNVTEGPAKAYDKSMDTAAIDPGSILPPHVAINAAYEQTGNVATGIDSWSVANKNGTPLYNIQFHDAQNKPVNITLDAKTGKAVK